MAGNLVPPRQGAGRVGETPLQGIQSIAVAALRAALSPSGAALKARHWAARVGLECRAHNRLPRCTQLT